MNSQLLIYFTLFLFNHFDAGQSVPLQNQQMTKTQSAGIENGNTVGQGNTVPNISEYPPVPQPIPGFYAGQNGYSRQESSYENRPGLNSFAPNQLAYQPYPMQAHNSLPWRQPLYGASATPNSPESTLYSSRLYSSLANPTIQSSPWTNNLTPTVLEPQTSQPIQNNFRNEQSLNRFFPVRNDLGFEQVLPENFRRQNDFGYAQPPYGAYPGQSGPELMQPMSGFPPTHNSLPWGQPPYGAFAASSSPELFLYPSGFYYSPSNLATQSPSLANFSPLPANSPSSIIPVILLPSPANFPPSAVPATQSQSLMNSTPLAVPATQSPPPIQNNFENLQPLYRVILMINNMRHELPLLGILRTQIDSGSVQASCKVCPGQSGPELMQPRSRFPPTYNNLPKSQPSSEASATLSDPKLTQYRSELYSPQAASVGNSLSLMESSAPGGQIPQSSPSMNSASTVTAPQSLPRIDSSASAGPISKLSQLTDSSAPIALTPEPPSPISSLSPASLIPKSPPLMNLSASDVSASESPSLISSSPLADSVP